MRFPTSETNDTLDSDALPSTIGNELNYRTRPDIGTERSFTFTTLKASICVVTVSVLLLQLFGSEFRGYIVIAFFGWVWWSVPNALRSEPLPSSKLREFTFVAARFSRPLHLSPSYHCE